MGLRVIEVRQSKVQKLLLCRQISWTDCQLTGWLSQSCPILWDPLDWGMLGFSIPHHLLEFAQVHVHCIRNAIQPSYPLMPSSSALNLSQHQELFQWVGCSRQMTKILELQLQHLDPSNDYSGLISCKTDWFDLLTVQGTLKSLL